MILNSEIAIHSKTSTCEDGDFTGELLALASVYKHDIMYVAINLQYYKICFIKTKIFDTLKSRPETVYSTNSWS